jgi:hypothetical protein
MIGSDCASSGIGHIERALSGLQRNVEDISLRAATGFFPYRECMLQLCSINYGYQRRSHA